jgi:hypothetical protein
LRGEQRITFKDSANLKNVLNYNNKMGTMFLAWMEANKKYPDGRHLTYTQYPTYFTYDSSGRFWKPRKRGGSIGRLTFIPPGSRELYYMRLLLNVQVGCTSFEDIRTVKGHVFDSCREACAALRLLDDDREFIDAITEVAILGSGFSLRKMFANLLMSNTMGDPLNVLEKLWDILFDGILHSRRRILNSPGNFINIGLCLLKMYTWLIYLYYMHNNILFFLDFILSTEELKQLCLYEIDNFL